MVLPKLEWTPSSSSSQQKDFLTYGFKSPNSGEANPVVFLNPADSSQLTEWDFSSVTYPRTRKVFPNWCLINSIALIVRSGLAIATRSEVPDAPRNRKFASRPHHFKFPLLSGSGLFYKTFSKLKKATPERKIRNGSVRLPYTSHARHLKIAPFLGMVLPFPPSCAVGF
ncbi:hypothetical protein CDAR_319701 [Caerostris darwini]|uniref:Uncharacterized protein n=1 Tax=Caerostris darwini TaxID=1538125 RepID=A0AAV4MBX8_9ARAC|nr:hypothetical protein CDAR_319701 [Caerostris darwini]